MGAKQFYAADLGAVVASSGFTRSAFDLARVSDVRLLGYAELAAFAKDL